jgi:hypothetical protein
MDKPNLILCTGWGYKVDLIAIFVESWKKYQKATADMIMLVEPDIKQDKLNYLLDSGVDVRFYTAGYFIPSAIHNTRYFKYLDILLEERGQYNRVFHCDVRDVAFQGDIFEEIQATPDQVDLFVNEEDPEANLGERFNKYILTTNYGEAVAKELEPNRILCSGTTLGSQEMMIQYIVTLMNQRDIKKMMEVGGIPDEQGPYNYIFHKNLIPHTKLENGTGVGTLCLVHPNQLKVLDDGRVTVYGKLPSVIHQWDRHNQIPHLINHYSNLYLKELGYVL